MKHFDRNKYFALGMFVLLLGIQFRLIDRIVLSQPVTEALARYQHPQAMQTVGTFQRLMPAVGPSIPRKVLQPPTWIGWLLLSTGGVLVMHSFALPKPEGG